MEFGWTVEYILRMPARRFFSVRKSMIAIERERRINNYIELCDIHFIPACSDKYGEALKEYYRAALNPDRARRMANPRVFMSDVREDSTAAAKILKATFDQKARLMGLRV